MTKISELPEATAVAEGDLLEIVQDLGSSPVSRRISAGNLGLTGGGGGGGAAGERYWVFVATNESSGTVPVADTLIPGMSITVPSAVVDRVGFLDWTVLYTSSHTNRLSVWLDGAVVTGIVTTSVHGGGNNTHDGSMSRVPLLLPAGSDHVVEVRWNASDSTAAVTFTDRIMVLDVYPGTTSPVAI